MNTTWTQEWPTGSAYIGSDRAPQDLDYLRFVHAEDKDAVVAALTEEGWELCGDAEYPHQGEQAWAAYRRGAWNIILCWCPLNYVLWVASTELAKKCGLIDKVERVELFKAVRDNSVTAATNVLHLSSFNTVAGKLMQDFTSQVTQE